MNSIDLFTLTASAPYIHIKPDNKQLITHAISKPNSKSLCVNDKGYKLVIIYEEKLVILTPKF